MTSMPMTVVYSGQQYEMGRRPSRHGLMSRGERSLDHVSFGDDGRWVACQGIVARRKSRRLPRHPVRVGASTARVPLWSMRSAGHIATPLLAPRVVWCGAVHRDGAQGKPSMRTTVGRHMASPHRRQRRLDSERFQGHVSAMTSTAPWRRVMFRVIPLSGDHRQECGEAQPNPTGGSLLARVPAAHRVAP